MKRAFDIVISLLVLIVIFPLMLVISISVKITSKGPIIYKQKRMGFQGTKFTIFKFRTLFENSERPASVDLVVNGKDSRITKVGRFLRGTHLDELPQFWNVLTGDMSIVGPRPKPVGEFEEILKKMPEYSQRLAAKPGMTGSVQILGREWLVLNFPDSLSKEVADIKNNSILRDMKIMIQTIRIMIQLKGI